MSERSFSWWLHFGPDDFSLWPEHMREELERRYIEVRIKNRDWGCFGVRGGQMILMPFYPSAATA